MTHKDDPDQSQDTKKEKNPGEEKLTVSLTNNVDSKINGMDGEDDFGTGEHGDFLFDAAVSGQAQQQAFKTKDQSLCTSTAHRNADDEEFSNVRNCKDNQDTCPGKIGPLSVQDYSQMIDTAVRGKLDEALKLLSRIFGQLFDQGSGGASAIASRDMLPPALHRLLFAFGILYPQSVNKVSGNLNGLYMESVQKRLSLGSGIVKKSDGEHLPKQESISNKSDEDSETESELKTYSKKTDLSLPVAKNLYMNVDDEESKEADDEKNSSCESVESGGVRFMGMDDEGEKALLIQYQKGRHILILASQQPGESLKTLEISQLEFDREVQPPKAEDYFDPGSQLPTDMTTKDQTQPCTQQWADYLNDCFYSSSLRTKMEEKVDLEDKERGDDDDFVRNVLYSGDNREGKEQGHSHGDCSDLQALATLMLFIYHPDIVFSQHKSQTEMQSIETTEVESEVSSDTREATEPHIAISEQSEDGGFGGATNTDDLLTEDMGSLGHSIEGRPIAVSEINVDTRDETPGQGTATVIVSECGGTSNTSINGQHLDSDNAAVTGFVQDAGVPHQSTSVSTISSSLAVTDIESRFTPLNFPVQVSSANGDFVIPVYLRILNESYSQSSNSVSEEERGGPNLSTREDSPAASVSEQLQSTLSFGACGGQAPVVAQEEGCYFHAGTQVEENSGLCITQESIYLFSHQQEDRPQTQAQCSSQQMSPPWQTHSLRQDGIPPELLPQESAFLLHFPTGTMHVTPGIPDWASLTAIIDLRQAANQNYMEMKKRRVTFKEDWQAQNGVDAVNMALAGFYRMDHGHGVRCFYCGLELGNLAPGDNIWDEHVRHNPSCHYLIAIMGQEFVLQTLCRLHNYGHTYN